MSLSKIKQVIAKQVKVAEDALKLDSALADFDTAAKNRGFESLAAVLEHLETLMAPEAQSATQVEGFAAGATRDKRFRARITPEKRTEILNLLRDESNKMTLNQIAEATGVSTPTVNAIKKSAGLVKARAKKIEAASEGTN